MWNMILGNFGFDRAEYTFWGDDVLVFWTRMGRKRPHAKIIYYEKNVNV